jgi:hypothetical protein
MNTMDGNESYHIQTGKPLIRTGVDAFLVDDPALWQQLWAEYRDELLLAWIKRKPGTRPAAFWRFDANGFPDRAEYETEAEHLHRLGLLDDDEINAIKAKALELIAFNRGRKPSDPNSNFIPDHEGRIQFCIDNDLLTEAESPPYF